MYEVYGEKYISDGMWGEVFLAEFATEKEAVSMLSKIVDGVECVGGSIYINEPDDDEDKQQRGNKNND